MVGRLNTYRKQILLSFGLGVVVTIVNAWNYFSTKSIDFNFFVTTTLIITAPNILLLSIEHTITKIAHLLLLLSVSVLSALHSGYSSTSMVFWGWAFVLMIDWEFIKSHYFLFGFLGLTIITALGIPKAEFPGTFINMIVLYFAAFMGIKIAVKNTINRGKEKYLKIIEHDQKIIRFVNDKIKEDSQCQAT